MTPRRNYTLVVPYHVQERPRRLRVDVETDDLLTAAASAWRTAEAMRPLLGGTLDEGGPILLIAPLPRAA